MKAQLHPDNVGLAVSPSFSPLSVPQLDSVTSGDSLTSAISGVVVSSSYPTYSHSSSLVSP